MTKNLLYLNYWKKNFVYTSYLFCFLGFGIKKIFKMEIWCRYHHYKIDFFLKLLSLTYWSLAFVQATAVSKTRISWRSRRIRGRLVTRNPVTMATKIMAILSSAFLRLALQLFGTPEGPGVPGEAAACRMVDGIRIRDWLEAAEVSRGVERHLSNKLKFS